MEENTFQQPTKDSIIVEIRAGVGGDEAALFAADLFNAYSKYANSQGFNVSVMDESFNELKGYKEVIFKITGPGVYDKFQYEGGVHRVQRIPKTEKSGRIHTSTISVAIMPIPSQTEIQIQPHEIRFEACKSGGAGGQNVNKRETAVRIVHIPTNIVATSQSERSQFLNKEKAMKILLGRLYQLKEQEVAKEVAQVKGAKMKIEFGSQIRSYVLHPYKMVKDLRTDVETSQADRVLDGEIEEFIQAEVKSKDF